MKQSFVSHSKFFRTELGTSLIELLIVAGIMAAIGLAVATMLSDQFNQTRGVKEKLLANDLEGQLKQYFANTTYCDCTLTGKTFDLQATPPVIVATDQLTRLGNGFSSPAPACATVAGDFIPPVGSTIEGSNVTVSSVGLGPLTQVSPGVYKSEVSVGLGNTLRPLRPIRTSIQFSIDTSGGTGPTARPFVACSNSSAPAAPDPAEFDLLFGGAYGDGSAGFVNPATGAKSCPPGYSVVTPLGQSNVDWPLHLCYRDRRDTSTSFPTNYWAFGGMYGDSGGHENPYTGGLSCPSGYSTSQVMGVTGTDWGLYICTRALGSVVPVAGTNSYGFGGFFSNGVQAAPNPLTGTSSCPAGYSRSHVYGAPNQDYDLTICTR